MADQALINQILQLRSQNLTNDDIAQRLLYQGYSNAQVFDAISQADITPAVDDGQQAADYGVASSYTYDNQMPSPTMAPQQVQNNTVSSDRIEEIAESIIEEKWSDLIEHVNKIVEWKSSVDTKLTSMDDQIKSIKSDFDVLQKSILGRINDSDTTMREVSTDIKALEQVFKRILPGFVENVNELSRITETMKRK